MQEPFIVRVYGGSCDYYLGRGPSGAIMGVMGRGDAIRFPSEAAARAVGQWAFSQGKIGHWEIRREGQK